MYILCGTHFNSYALAPTSSQQRGTALKAPLIQEILSDPLKGNMLSGTSGYPQFAGRRGAKAMGTALSWNDSIAPFSLCRKERGGRGGWGGWEGGFTPVRTSSSPSPPPPFPILDMEKRELLHLA